jgi:hypothetical protein
MILISTGPRISIQEELANGNYIVHGRPHITGHLVFLYLASLRHIIPLTPGKLSEFTTS